VAVRQLALLLAIIILVPLAVHYIWRYAVVVYDATPPDFRWAEVGIRYTDENGDEQSEFKTLSEDRFTPAIVPLYEDLRTFQINVYISDDSLPDSVTCTITFPDGSTDTIALSHVGGYEYSAWATYYLEEGEYTFSFTCTDLAGNTASQDYYLKVAGAPEGFFTINGERVDQTSIIYVRDPSLAIAFVCTKNPELVEEVYISIYKDGQYYDTKYLDQESSDTWACTYTLPEEGTYDIRGYVKSPTGTYQFMQIFYQWTAGPISAPTIPLGPIIEAVLIAVAVVAAVVLAHRRGWLKA